MCVDKYIYICIYVRFCSFPLEMRASTNKYEFEKKQ